MSNPYSDELVRIQKLRDDLDRQSNLLRALEALTKKGDISLEVILAEPHSSYSRGISLRCIPGDVSAEIRDVLHAWFEREKESKVIEP